jgi:hypothetical protein
MSVKKHENPFRKSTVIQESKAVPPENDSRMLNTHCQLKYLVPNFVSENIGRIMFLNIPLCFVDVCTASSLDR